MQTTNEDQNGQCEVARPSRKARRGAWWAGLGLAALSVAVVAAHYITPVVPGRAENLPARVAWYLQHGQVRADLQTLASAVKYLVEPDRTLAATTNQTDLPLTANPPQGLPKS